MPDTVFVQVSKGYLLVCRYITIRSEQGLDVCGREDEHVANSEDSVGRGHRTEHAEEERHEVIPSTCVFFRPRLALRDELLSICNA